MTAIDEIKAHMADASYAAATAIRGGPAHPAIIREVIEGTAYLASPERLSYCAAMDRAAYRAAKAAAASPPLRFPLMTPLWADMIWVGAWSLNAALWTLWIVTTLATQARL